MKKDKVKRVLVARLMHIKLDKKLNRKDSLSINKELYDLIDRTVTAYDQSFITLQDMSLIVTCATMLIY